MVGLYETVSAGADRLPDSPDPERWPCALGVRPLAAVPPPVAQRFPGQQGPQSGLPERVYDQVAIRRMYAAVAQSSPPPGPRTLEQRVHQLDRADVGEDVLDAVKLLGRDARRAAVVETALELGEWSADELAARAWYTGWGARSHIRHLVLSALNYEHAIGRLRRQHGGGLTSSRASSLVRTTGVPLAAPRIRKGERGPRSTSMPLSARLRDTWKFRTAFPSCSAKAGLAPRSRGCRLHSASSTSGGGMSWHSPLCS